MSVFLKSARAVMLLSAALLAMLSMSAMATELRLDPDKVSGPDACGECHESSVAAWKGTHHFSTFKDMPRSEEARAIADKLGIARLKSESDCLGCHFTSAMDEGKVKPIAGITCESCHGAGKNWIDVHSSFGGKDDTAETETDAHRKERYAKSEAAGMIRPSNLYALTENCYQCHTVPNERLVNVGGHPAGSKFELVRWTQGEVRHNLWYNEGAENSEASIERRRMLYVIGKMIDLEYALRGVADATTKGDYAIAMAKRAKTSILWLKKIGEAQSIPEIDGILADVGSASLKLNNQGPLLAAADQVAGHARAFADNHDGSGLGGVDPLLPSADKYRGKPH